MFDSKIETHCQLQSWSWEMGQTPAKRNLSLSVTKLITRQHAKITVSPEETKSEGQTILLQKWAHLQSQTARSLPSFVPHFSSECRDRLQEREISGVHTAELRLLAARHRRWSAYICIHFHCLPCRREAQKSRKCHACAFVSPPHPAEGTPLIHSGVARMKFHVIDDSGQGLNYCLVPEAVQAAGIRTGTTLLLANGLILLHSCVWPP